MTFEYYYNRDYKKKVWENPNKKILFKENLKMTISMNIGIHMSLLLMVFSGYMPSSGAAGSYGRCVPRFLRDLHPVLHNCCISLHSHQ